MTEKSEPKVRINADCGCTYTFGEGDTVYKGCDEHQTIGEQILAIGRAQTKAVAGRWSGMDTDCLSTADHCPHETGEVLTTPSPQVGERCCWCGNHRYRRTPFGSGGGHGEHKPQHGGYVCPCGFGSEDPDELVRHLATHDLNLDADVKLQDSPDE